MNDLHISSWTGNASQNTARQMVATQNSTEGYAIILAGRIPPDFMLFPASERRVRVVKEQITTGGSNLTAKTVIETLDDDRFVVKKKIPVTVEALGEDEYVAEFPLAGIAMAGESVHSAVHGLRDAIIDTLMLYKRESRLGPEPKRRLRILEAYIGQEGGK